MTVCRPARTWPLAVLLALALPGAARAQSAQGWTPAQVGIRFGYADRMGGSVLGAQLRIPVIPRGFVELVPNADITFFHGTKIHQYAIDAVFVSGGRGGGLVVGGGPLSRNGVFSDGSPRETKRGWDVVVGLKTMPGRGVPFGIQLQERWVLVSLPVKPRVLSLGVNFPLWGWGHFRD